MKKITYSEAKEKFIGMTVASATPEHYRRCRYSDDECRGDCNGCSDCSVCELELKVDKVHSTRRSFLLECDAVNTTIVISKDRAADFELHSAELSPGLLEQVCNLGLELDEEKFLFCRTWRGNYRRYQYQSRIFVYPCERERANCLIVKTRTDDSSLIDWELESHLGGEGTRVRSCSSRDGITGYHAIDFWRFRYDPKTDQLIVPEEDLDHAIDIVIEN